MVKFSPTQQELLHRLQEIGVGTKTVVYSYVTRKKSMVIDIGGNNFSPVSFKWLWEKGYIIPKEGTLEKKGQTTTSEFRINSKLFKQ